MSYESLPTQALRVGMIVNCHGLRCLIDEPLRQTTHADGKTFATDARILNRASDETRHVPPSFTERPDGVHRWTIQGNHLAHWGVVVHGPEHRLETASGRFVESPHHLRPATAAADSAVAMPADVAAFPLEPGESILWWRAHPDGGHEICVRTASGFEGMHDTYPAPTYDWQSSSAGMCGNVHVRVVEAATDRVVVDASPATHPMPVKEARAYAMRWGRSKRYRVDFAPAE